MTSESKSNFPEGILDPIDTDSLNPFDISPYDAEIKTLHSEIEVFAQELKEELKKYEALTEQTPESHAAHIQILKRLQDSIGDRMEMIDRLEEVKGEVLEDKHAVSNIIFSGENNPPIEGN